jgi:signal transduction histidine kinase
MQRTDVDLDDLVGAELRRLRSSGGPVVEGVVPPVRVAGDAAKLSQVIRNLADNAVHAAKGRVRLTLSERDGIATLRVEDDGPGIPVADRDRVFERFVRLDDSRARGSGGSGLGLAIVREVLRGHGGTVEVSESALGGACLTVTLPTAGQPPSASSR